MCVCVFEYADANVYHHMCAHTPEIEAVQHACVCACVYGCVYLNMQIACEYAESNVYHDMRAHTPWQRIFVEYFIACLHVLKEYDPETKLMNTSRVSVIKKNDIL